MMGSRLALRFKGDRNYLHGTDIFGSIVAWASAQSPGGRVTDVDVSFHRLAQYALDLFPDEQPARGDPAAICAFKVDDQRQKVFLYESAESVDGRYPYPEDEIVKNMTFDLEKSRGVLAGELPFSEIEVWVAMTKALHLKVFSHLDGKWLFVRGRLPVYPCQVSTEERALVIVSNLRERLTRSELFVNGQLAGEIYFSRV